MLSGCERCVESSLGEDAQAAFLFLRLFGDLTFGDLTCSFFVKRKRQKHTYGGENNLACIGRQCLLVRGVLHICQIACMDGTETSPSLRVPSIGDPPDLALSSCQIFWYVFIWVAAIRLVPVYVAPSERLRCSFVPKIRGPIVFSSFLFLFFFCFCLSISSSTWASNAQGGPH